MSIDRKLGILMPVFSLDSSYGIGTFGKCAYDFVDFLSGSGAAYWQVLPLCPVGYGGSPYSSPADGAINPYFIDLDVLVSKGLLSKEEVGSYDFGEGRVDYGKQKQKLRLLKKAFKRYDGELSGHLDYALFMTLKDEFKGAPWYRWGEYADCNSEPIKAFFRTHIDKIRFWQFVQNEAFAQWNDLKSYAAKRGVKIIGDMPFYVAHDSVEVWTNKDMFDLDGVKPKSVAGVPPDYFSETGQKWGNPVYNMDNRELGDWWSKRIDRALNLYDTLRLDHFRAFDEFYAIPYGKRTAKVGQWKTGLGFDFFEGKKDLPIIAEDLGTITPSVKRLLSRTGYPGMRVLQFGFDGNPDNPHLASNIGPNSVCYTGTHDNMTLKEFVTSLSEGDLYRLTDILYSECGDRFSFDPDELTDAIIELGCATDAKLFVVPLADLLHKDVEYRINTPSTVSNLNWSSRIEDDYGKLYDKIVSLIRTYNR